MIPVRFAVAGSVALGLVGCCKPPSPVDAAWLEARLAEPSRVADPPAKVEHRRGGGVEVLVFSPGVNNRDFRASTDAEKSRILSVLAPGLPNDCKGASPEAPIARLWGLGDGAFRAAHATEKVALIRIDHCFIPGRGAVTRGPTPPSWLLGVLDASDRPLARIPLAGDTTLEAAPDLLGEGRNSLVLVTRTGSDAEPRMTVRLARLEGESLVTLAESPAMDGRCRSPWDAPALLAVLRPGRPVEFRTTKPEARCAR